MTTLQWKGYSWDVRDTGGQLSGPGPNYWSASAQNAWIDNAGALHLAIRKDSSGKLFSTELDGPHLGYGTYKWVVNSDPRQFDAQTVLGLFTYDNAAQEGPPYYAREIDIEFAKWSTPDNATPIMFSVQQGGKGVQAVKGGSPPITCYFIWSPGKVYFNAVDAGGALLGEYTCTTGVQEPSQEVCIMNLWHSDPQTAPGAAQEAVLTDFAFSTATTTPQQPPAGDSIQAGDRVRVTGGTWSGKQGVVKSIGSGEYNSVLFDGWKRTRQVGKQYLVKI